MLILFSLGISSYFSGQTLYDPVLDTLYNILFTAYPIGWFATYDKEINYDKLESKSELYIDGMKNKYFNLYIFWRWYLYAFSAGLLIYWICTTVLSFAVQCADSQLLDLWAVGSCMYTCIVLIVNLKIMFSTNTHNCFSVFLLFFSIGIYFSVFFFTSQMSSLFTLGHWEIIMKNKLYLGTIAHVVTVCLLVEYGWRSLQFIIEEYIIKQTRVAPLKIQNKSDSVIHKIYDEGDNNKDYTIKISHNGSINSRKSGSGSEHSLVIKDDLSTIKKHNVSDSDQTILTNNNRRCNNNILK
jgi:magnesium-transporting ATPase (P-type)